MTFPDYTTEFYIGLFEGHYTYFKPIIVLMTTEKQPVLYSIEAPWVGYYTDGIITADNAATVEITSDLLISSFYDQSKGIYIKTTSNKVTVQSDYNPYCYRYCYYMNNLETLTFIPVTGLCASKYEYYAISLNGNSSDHNSSVLVVGTEDNTKMKLTVTHPVTISISNVISHLIPYKEYSFTINRLQTVYFGSQRDLTGSKIVTNKEVSVFSGHRYGYILNSPSSYLIKQIPPTLLWGRIHHVMPLKDVPAGYAIKIVASSQCVIQIYCNSSLFSTDYLNDQGFTVKKILNNETCTIQSDSSILVAQFSLGVHYTSGYGDLLMALVPSTEQYYNEFTFSVLNSKQRNSDDTYSYANIIVMAEYYEPEEIYLVNGYNTSLVSQLWVPVMDNNVTKAYATQMTLPSGIVRIFHNNRTALMTVVMYGFLDHGSYGNAIYGYINIGMYNVAMHIYH